MSWFFSSTRLCNKMLRSWLSTYKWFFFTLIHFTVLFLSLYRQMTQYSKMQMSEKISVPLSLMIRLSHSVSKSLLPIFYQQSVYYIDTLIVKNLYYPFVFPHPTSNYHRNIKLIFKMHISDSSY